MNAILNGSLGFGEKKLRTEYLLRQLMLIEQHVKTRSSYCFCWETSFLKNPNWKIVLIITLWTRSNSGKLVSVLIGQIDAWILI